MFPEYRHVITQLKSEQDRHFLKLYEKHNDLDTVIALCEAHNEEQSEINRLKLEKLHIKDEIYQYLKERAE